ncbi:hypothetical protein MAF45_02010 [Mesosutterella sp. OilRF-GAM-744-9]|uniref:Outer-membrane lipoprotein LolB n=1 Tax=Mesosutterella porci TaxID=2915351 RepID=A0ABS9MNP2_9BURK|nr:lipoprotein insertase outer membrane protein LolB [Mesosutterella sp. oilRF-744-WT-GAM-9]MCG5030231.1 hypothetical protein [Mesosutterella sp. oilRF-744-WT-GAM-9]MCI6530297.1 hypothetical protein [Mesosutterella sp.]
MKRRFFLAAAFASLLAGCSALRPPEGERVQRQIEGRFSISVESSGDSRSDRGSFVWTEAEGWQRLDIGHPLAGTLMRLTMYPGRAVFEDGSGKKLEGRSAQALMAEYLGFDFPIAAFRSLLEADTGTADSFELQGWDVSVVQRTSQGLPQLVRLRKEPSEGSPLIRATLFIDSRQRYAR